MTADDMNSGDAKRLRVGVLSPIRDLDPIGGGTELSSSVLLAQIYDTPYDAAQGGGYEPALFARPLSQESEGVYSAPVRGDRHFSDGSPLTAAAIAESLEASGRLAGIGRAEASDDRVVFHLGDSSLQRLESILATSPVAKAVGGRFLGTGPYMLADGSTPERTRLVRNPHSPTDPDLDEVVFVTYPPDASGSPEALIQAIGDGEVDFTNALSREDLSRLKLVRKWFEPGVGTAILYLNTERLGDEQLRRGIALAIDRAELAKASYPNPLAFTAAGLLPPMLGSMRDSLSHDPKQAGIAIGRAAERPSSLTMLVIWGPRPYLPHPRQTAQAIADALGKVGLDVRIQQAADAGEYFRRIARGDYDMALTGWISDTPDSGDFLASILHSREIPAADRRIVTEGNLAHYRSADMDAALDAYRRNPGAGTMAKVQEILDREVPLVPLMYGPTIFVYSPRVTTFQPSPIGIPLFADMEML
jgi:ABC-type transport system substrate-binding protein